MSDLLTPEQSADLVGAPAVQLRRWAYLGIGPRNSGTKHKPLYAEHDLTAYRDAKRKYRETINALFSGVAT